jgi:hypothetical protein
MDEGAKRMEEGLNIPLDVEAKDVVLKKQETTNNILDSNIKQQIVEVNDQQPPLVKQKTKRVATLDAFRGLTIVVSYQNHFLIDRRNNKLLETYTHRKWKDQDSNSDHDVRLNNFNIFCQLS